MYIFRGRGVFIDVYKADDKIVTSGATSLADIDLWRTYRAIDSVATCRIPSIFCDLSLLRRVTYLTKVQLLEQSTQMLVICVNNME